MRLLQRDKRKVTFMKRMDMQADDGTVYEGWGSPLQTMAAVYPAGGRVDSQIYGQRIAYMKTLHIEKAPEGYAEGDGVVLNGSDKPDYKIIAMPEYPDHAVMMLEKVKP